MSLRFETIPSSDTKPRRQRPKIEKSAEEFKQHEQLLMNKRNQEVNNAVTKKCHVIWNQFLSDQAKPNPLQFNFVYHNIDKYLNVCDSYQPSQHKDPKQKWWNNQKASEMSQQFLPSILNSTDQMAEYLGNQISDILRPQFTNYCVFELLETAITAVFSTMRSGSNEVFLRTSFQYSKANLRKKLVSYFTEQELRCYDLKQRKKKDLWTKLIKQKKDILFKQFNDKKESLYGDHKNVKLDGDEYITSHNTIQSNCTLPPSIHSIHSIHSNHSTHSHTSDSMSCSTANNSVNNIMNIPPINWNECEYNPINSNNTTEYQPFRAVSLAAPYQPDYKTEPLQVNGVHCSKLTAYGHHRQCTDCLSYMNKMSELLSMNTTLQEESNHLKQLNHQYVADGQKWRNKYQNLLNAMDNVNNSNNNNDSNAAALQWMDSVNDSSNAVPGSNLDLMQSMQSLDGNAGNWQRFDV
eukprot:15607_1